MLVSMLLLNLFMMKSSLIAGPRWVWVFHLLPSFNVLLHVLVRLYYWSLQPRKWNLSLLFAKVMSSQRWNAFWIFFLYDACQAWTDVKLTSPQLSRESIYKLSLKNLMLQCVSSRQVLLWTVLCVCVLLSSEISDSPCIDSFQLYLHIFDYSYSALNMVKRLSRKISLGKMSQSAIFLGKYTVEWIVWCWYCISVNRGILLWSRRYNMP